MNDEIKEILRILKVKSKRYEYCLNANISFSDESYEAHLLLDYITNLQQENENNQVQLRVVRKDYKEYMKRTVSYQDYLEEQLEDYKFRCEKASEYIERRRERVNPEKTIYVNGNDLLNILQGDNDATN